MGQHHDETGPGGVPDGLADRGEVPEHLLDRQSRAFRENPDPVDDADLEHHAEAVHPPLGMGRGEPTPIVLPDEWDGLGWDAGREGPKGLDEARVALAERIADPQAPDGDEVRGAYDGLEDELGHPNPGSSGGGA